MSYIYRYGVLEKGKEILSTQPLFYKLHLLTPESTRTILKCSNKHAGPVCDSKSASKYVKYQRRLL